MNKVGLALLTMLTISSGFIFSSEAMASTDCDAAARLYSYLKSNGRPIPESLTNRLRSLCPSRNGVHYPWNPHPTVSNPPQTTSNPRPTVSNRPRTRFSKVCTPNYLEDIAQKDKNMAMQQEKFCEQNGYKFPSTQVITPELAGARFPLVCSRENLDAIAYIDRKGALEQRRVCEKHGFKY